MRNPLSGKRNQGNPSGVPSLDCDWCDCKNPDVLIAFANSITGEIVDATICQAGLKAVRSHTAYDGKSEIWLFTKARRFNFDMWEAWT